MSPLKEGPVGLVKNHPHADHSGPELVDHFGHK
jgi:hypothetical protein